MHLISSIFTVGTYIYQSIYISHNVCPIGCSVFVSVLITAVLMYLREASRKADDEDQADVAENSDDSS